MRQSITKALHETFKQGDRIIELGCGTGDDAIDLATQGCEIIATDPSSKMIEIASKKASTSRAGRNVRFLVGGGANWLRDPAGMPTDIVFDGGYANFSLSYEPDLPSVSEALASWLRPGGRLLIAAMNRLCGVEMAIALLSGHPRLAGRRLALQTLHKVGEFTTAVYPRTTEELVDAFRRHFVLEDARALPAILPPHYANQLLIRWGALMAVLERLDPLLGAFPVVRFLGDYNLLRFRRKA